MKEPESKASPLIKSSPKPMITNKLPKAFCTPSLKHVRYPSRNSKEALQQEEFKRTSQLLSPIKLTNAQKKVMKSNLFRMGSSIFRDRSRNFSYERVLAAPHRVSLKVLPHSSIHAEDMITLSVVSNSMRGGCLKKVLHAPSLRLYAVKEVPIGTREVRQELYEWVGTWEKAQKRTPQLVQLQTTFWNTPEGSMSFVLEHIKGYSLLSLVEQLGCPIPESALSTAVREVLKALKGLYEKTGSHGGISSSQVLFSREGEVKLSLGLLSRTVRESKGKTIQGDLKDLGSALLVAVCGGVEWIESDGTSPKCCLLHSLEHSVPTLHRASPDLKHFICSLLRSQDSSIDSILTHSWLSKLAYPGPSLSLKDLCNINSSIPEQSSPVNCAAANQQLQRICHALYVLGDGLKTKRQGLCQEDASALAEELGLEPSHVWQRIAKVL